MQLADLTGAPYKAYDVPSDANDAMWNKLMSADKAGFVMCAAVPPMEGEDAEKTLGLVEAHAYVFLVARRDAGI